MPCRNVHPAVLLIAFEKTSVEGSAAVAIDDQGLRDAFLQACHRHQNLERRTGCELRLDRFVHKRFAGILN